MKNILFLFILISCNLKSQNPFFQVNENQNFLLIGIENRIHLSDLEIKTSEISVTTNFPEFIKIFIHDNSLVLQIMGTIPLDNDCLIKFTNTKTGKEFKTLEYQLRRIPNPEACLNNKQSQGNIHSEVMKIQKGLMIFFGDLYIKDACVVTSFTLTYTGPNQSPITFQNKGAKFEKYNLELIQKAKPGAMYQFTDVYCRCIGDSSSRSINNMQFITY